MNRISKLLIVGWTAAVLLIECWYVSGSWYSAFLSGIVLFFGFGVAATFDRRVVMPVLAISYLVPILIFEDIGRYQATYSVVWLAALSGVVLPDALRSGWNLPQHWSVPLVCWVGVVCATAPIVALRRVDFNWDLLFRGRLPVEALGSGVPLQTLGWILHVALLVAVGLLWFDWLCGLDQGFFLRWVAAPLALSVSMLGAVALYQMFVDVTFLNYSVYAMLRRASGTVLDGNVAGTLAAFWIAGWIMLALATHGWRQKAALFMAVVMWFAVWSTGSRTAFALAFVVSAFSAFAFGPRMMMRRGFAAAAAVAIVVLVGTVMMPRSSAGAAGPIERFRIQFPEPTLESIAAATRELWNRNGYGVAATRIIATHPLFGVGVGSFYEMAGEFIPGGLPPDNAQNWYRHQLTELGIVGSLGWMVFVAWFGWWVIRRHPGEQRAASPARGALIAIGAISLLGMPGQDPLVAITLATFAAWFLIVAGRPSDTPPVPAHWWVIAAVVIVASMAGTTVLARTSLRVPVRIQRLGGAYLYGFSWPEPDGEGGEYRWARRKATAVIAAPTRSFKLRLRANHGDMAEHPTRVKAWVDGRLVIDGALTAGADTLEAAVFLPSGEQRVLIETWADRSVIAPPPDGRELAVMVRWRFAPTSR